MPPAEVSDCDVVQHVNTVSVDSGGNRYMRSIDMRQIMDRFALRYEMNAGVVKHIMNQVLPEACITHDEVTRRIAQLLASKDYLAGLLSRPQIKQRTPQWYEARMEMITASDIAQALGQGKFGTQKQFFWKKCIPEPSDAFASLANCPPIKWGVMFEDVASKLYSHTNCVKVHDFGLLRHPSIRHLGASPDGISELGVMLEIKCPYRRQITGEVPLQYFYQIQGQLEVCGLQECDYLEVGFVEMSRLEFYESPTRYENHGIIAEFIDRTSRVSSYEYSGVDWFDVELNGFEQSARDTAATMQRDLRFHYWRVDKYSCVRITRDDDFIKTMLDSVAKIWARVEAYREDSSLMQREIGLPPTPGERKTRPKNPSFMIADIQEYAFQEVPSVSSEVDVNNLKTNSVLENRVPTAFNNDSYMFIS